MAYQKIWIVISLYLSAISTIFHHLKSFFFKTNWDSIFFRIPDTLVSLYFRLCGLSPCTVDIDDQTTVHFWTANHRRFDKPSLVLVHGYGGNSLWQFVCQVGPLSKKFNVYVPDLLFFGKSYTNRSDRSESFQAKCVMEGLKRLGVDRYSVYGISYGGFVAYRMAEMCPETVEKVVIVSSGVVWNDQQKEELLRKNSNALEILVANNPHDLRLLVSRSIYKYDVFKWVPDYVLQKLIEANKENRKEKLELLEHLVAKKADPSLAILSQETLIIWGDQDNVFPLYMAYQLQRHLGPKSKLEIIKDTGHAANFDSPDTINGLIKSFVLGV
ncbi:uncharacterized protein LOC133741450 [Rosa rugosa]|uniref:uncharacterized protein LOC133741450 n=1 Tax=Rosa rugosa TaxID=74645 RepID=UPI002B40FC49|nr:uncharacterized protein LOC133741450 [Rosa rugosa]